MCGIAGILKPAPSLLEKNSIESLMNCLAHRGPDAKGSWNDESGNVLLMHRRLSIIDLSERASQPLHYNDRYVVIHNGEIYNYPELKKELEKQGYAFQSDSDTEVIAASYDHWKEECLGRFDGMFAFAIWDRREQQLFAARDRFGEKPFFYHYNGVQLFFASEMKALWQAGLRKAPNLKMLFNFITIGYTGNPEKPAETFFEGIQKLPPAHFFHCRPGGAPEIKRYWTLDPENINRNITDAEATGKFRELLNISVKRRLRCDVSLGSSLSGGIDSSTVLSLALQQGQMDPLSFSAFTAVFPGFDKNEEAFARLVADQKQIRLHSLPVDASGFPAEWEEMMHYQEEPVGSASVFPQFKIFQLARQMGVKVLLDGQGADEILAGYSKYYKWYWQELFRKAKLVRSGELRAARKAGVTEPFGLRNMIAALFPDMASVVLERRYLLQALRHPELDTEFIRQQSREAYYATPPYFTLNGALHFSTCDYGLEELLRYADRNAMSQGREVRLPFLSHELVEFVFSLPPNFKIREGRTKWILRETMKNDLPAEITWRKDKVGFEPPQKQWMQQEPVREMIREAKQLLAGHGVLKKQALQNEIRPMGAHEADNFDWRYLSASVVFK